ncbi:botulinum neurotoxin type B [Clostridium botulinum]|uniref:Botulinum neurotoxin type B n=5 Tax=Clostridium TaxID=1485 RepID=A2I2W0_CLOBO|nr:botulinum neurotoxin subtype B4 [Clostridium botulinum]ABM73987.1 neurotoxin B [Clostridium botulinum B str. Eklund 17B (NRP)]AIJ01283.1 neurotoxin type B [Clostridium botulinum B]ACD14195.1 bontoxilysin A [Clostridium botulinum B str. Eklund 17B (NRP)]AIJ01284.1 neurotoxin type B [Clostridium botulinum]AIW54524.1 botulinum neurotoxin type B precursor [Clostridium botulinum]
MPVTINNFNYNDPIDNDNIIMMEPPFARGTGRYYKAFKITDRIWIIPERYTFGYKPEDFNKSSGIFNRDVCEYYDPDYLNTNDKKNIFLQTMIKLFNRIKSKPLGEKLLEMIINGIPYLGDRRVPLEEFNTNIASVTVNKLISNPGEVEQKKGIFANLIIFGPGPVLNENETIDIGIQNHFASREGFGGIMQMKFCPEYVSVFNNVQENKGASIFNRRGYFSDPALILMHELIHVLHGLYGIKVDDLPIVPNEKKFFMQSTDTIQAEELYTFGGQDPSIISPSTDKSIYDKVLQNFRGIVDRLNKVLVCISDPNININIYKNKFKDKYKFVEDSEGKYSIDVESFNKLYKSLMFGFTEINIAENYKIKTRASYFSDSLPPVKIKNLLDNEIYTIEEGFNISDKNMGKEYRGQNKAINKQAYEEISKEHLAVYKIQMCKSVKVPGICIDVDNENLFFIADKNSFSDDLSKNERVEYNTQNNYIGNDFPINELILDTDLISKIELPSENTESLTDFNVDVPVYEKQPAIKKVFTDENTIFQYLYSQTFPLNIRDISLTSSFDDALLVSSKVYSFFSMDYIKTANKVVEAGLFAGWVKQIVDDFVIEANKSSTMDKIADISLIVPYIGLALNVGDETAKGNFESAFEIAGSSILLEFIPELLIPVVGVFLLESYIDNKNKIIKTIDNALTKRVEKWIDMYGLIVAQWLSTVNTQFYTIKEGMYKALNYQAQALEEIIKYKYNIYSEEEKSNININFNDINSKLNDGINQAMDNINDFINECSVSYLMKKMIPLAVKKLLDFDNTLKKNLLNYIDENKLYLIGSVEDEKSKVDKYLKTIIPFDLSTYTNNEILIKIFNKYNSEILNNIILNLRYRDNNLIDLSGYGAKVEVYDGVKLNDKNQFKLTSSADSKIRVTQNQNIIFNSMFLDFSVSFWIRIPKYRNDDIQNYIHNEYTIINCMKNNSGWKISIRGNRIIWTLIDINGKTKSVFFEYNIREDISEYINRWFFVTITNNLDNAKIYINGTLESNMDIKDIGEVIVNGEITFKLDGDVDRTQFIWMKYFSIFNTQLNQSNIKEIYKIQSYSEYLKDFWGNPLMYNKEYYMFNAGNKNSYIKLVKDSSVGEILIRSKYNQNSNYINYRNLYIGEKFIIRRKSNSQSINDDIVRKEDYIHLDFVNSNEEWRVYAYKNFKEQEQKLFLSIIYDSNEFYKTIQIKEYDEQPTYSCQLLFKKDEESTDDIGLIGIHRFYESGVLRKKYKDYFCISKWYLKEVKRKPYKSNLGCNWQFIPKDEGWTE